MLLTVFLSIVFCAAMALMLISCVAFIQDNKFFSSAPKEAREVLIQREREVVLPQAVLLTEQAPEEIPQADLPI